VTPVVAIDIDGTLADFHGHLLRFLVQWTGSDIVPILKGSIDPYDGSESWSDYCCRLFDIDRTTFRQAKLAYRQGGLKRTMPVIDGAQRICHTVKEAGAELWLTTTRPYLSLDNIIVDTTEWLERQGIAFDGLLFDEDKYAKLAEQVDSERVVAVLDDLEEMCRAASDVLHYGVDVAILMRNKYNAAMDWPSVAASLPQAGQMIELRLNYWREQHGYTKLRSRTPSRFG